MNREVKFCDLVRQLITERNPLAVARIEQQLDMILERRLTKNTESQEK